MRKIVSLLGLASFVFIILTAISTLASAPVTNCVSQGTGMFYNCASTTTLDTSQVNMIERRSDFEAAMMRCYAAGYTRTECEESVTEGEF